MAAALAVLQREARDFRPAGGLLSWQAQIELRYSHGTMTLRISTRVPCRETGAVISVYFDTSIHDFELCAAAQFPREFLRAKIREAVLHEMDESITFREFRRPSRTPYSFLGEPPLMPLSSDENYVNVRPFDPHKET